MLLPLAMGRSASFAGAAGTLAALGCAMGAGFGLGVAAAAAVLLRPRELHLLSGTLGNTLRLLLLRLGGAGSPCTNAGSSSGRGGVPCAPPATHYVLRPGSDPRVDQAIFVRYDPPADRKTGAIIVVCPGGNYDESGVHCGEGQPVAQWLTTLGITGVVLQYRCVSEGHYWPAQYEDWLECARAVVAQAVSWGCDPARVGVLGFSAGGHLAGYVACKAPPELAPALQVLVYPSIDTETPHEDGDIDPWFPEKGYPPPETSVHLNVGAGAPPAFLAGIISDTFCPAKENTDVYAKALEENSVPYEYVTTDEHEHGCGLQDWWTVPCTDWLVKLGWAVRPTF